MATTSGRDRRWIGWLLLAWAAAAAAMLWYRWGAIHWFALPDTDDNIRFAQVRDWLNGQRWYDLRQYRLDPPRGASIHWSRLVDLPIAGLILAVRPFAGTLVANKAAVALAPLIPMALALFGGALAVRRLVAPAAWPLAVALTLGGQAALWMWMPLRIDHHGWQLALLILTVAGAADPRGTRGGPTMGLATAASLTVGLEMLPYFAIAAVVLVARWVADGTEARRLATFGASLAAGAALGYAGFASYDNRQALCDALSPVWLSDALLGGALAVGLAALPLRNWRTRGLLALLAGAAVAGFHVAAWPQCLGRPENVSPELVRLWLGNVKEARPIYLHPWRTALQVAALPVAGLVGAAWATWSAWRTPRFAAWASALLFVAAACALLLWQMRAGPAAQVLAVPGAAAPAYALWRRLDGHRHAWAQVLGGAAGFLAISGLWTNIVVRLLPAPPAPPPRGLKSVKQDRSRFCPTLRSLRPIARLPAATFLTFVDFGPRLIATTRHGAIAGPYHRNGAAILDVHHAWRGTAAAAHDIVRRHGVGYVMTCPGMAESTIYAAQAPRGFYMALTRGQAPDWLRPVPLPEGSPLRLWRVTG